MLLIRTVPVKFLCIVKQHQFYHQILVPGTIHKSTNKRHLLLAFQMTESRCSSQLFFRRIPKKLKERLRATSSEYLLSYSFSKWGAWIKEWSSHSTLDIGTAHCATSLCLGDGNSLLDPRTTSTYVFSLFHLI